jgi:streptogramin lyase
MAAAALALTIGFVIAFNATSTSANHIPYAVGDVFAGVGAGQIKHFDPNGTLLEVLDNTSASSEQTGMCFDASGNLYTTNWTAGNMSKFNNQGGLLVHPWGGAFSLHPEMCVVDAAGNVYAGEVDGNDFIRKFDADGNPLDTFSPATESRGIDWLDLSADQCTMLYTSEGSSVKSYDVCADTQLADFAIALTGPCFALRVRTNGEVLVTCATQTYRLDTDGSVLTTYPIAGESLFAMNLDPDGENFWTGGITSGNVFKVNIATGDGTAAPLFNAGIVGGSMAGLAVFGEPTVSQPEPTPTPTPTPSPTATATPSPTPAPAALPPTGGQPSGGGLPWLALAAGVLAIASGGLALAYRTRRVR